MNMKEFYDKYNLNKYYFAEIAGVGTRSLIKFDNGESIRKDTKLRIETAIRVAEKYNLVRPEFNYGESIHWGFMYKNEFYKKVHEYEWRFKELIKKEMELA